MVLSTHNAPLSAVALKASVGAAENLKLLSVRSTGAFIQDSRRNGWRCYAAVAPLEGSHFSKESSRSQHRTPTATYCSLENLGDPLQNAPCMLMLGGEGSGLKPDLVKKADYMVNVAGQRSGLGGVDSLNVSVAAGILCEAFLREPKSLRIQNSVPVERDLF